MRPDGWCSWYIDVFIDRRWPDRRTGSGEGRGADPWGFPPLWRGHSLQPKWWRSYILWWEFHRTSSPIFGFAICLAHMDFWCTISDYCRLFHWMGGFVTQVQCQTSSTVCEDGNGNLQLTEIRGVLEDAGLLPQNDEDRERLRAWSISLWFMQSVGRCHVSVCQMCL